MRVGSVSVSGAVLLACCTALLALGAVSVDAGNCFTTAGVAMIKEFEGFYANFYKDEVGIKTIGYGTACHAYDCSKIHPPITEAQATAIMIDDLKRKYYGCVSSGVRVPISDNQFSALVSFVYNLGCGTMKTSTLVKKLNAKDYNGAAAEFAKWNKAGGRVLRGLTRRRTAEANLFRQTGGGTCANGDTSTAAPGAGQDQNPSSPAPDTSGGANDGGSPGGGSPGGGSPGGGSPGGGSPGGGDDGGSPGGGSPGGGSPGGGDDGGSPGGGSPGGGSPGGGDAGAAPGGGAPGGGDASGAPGGGAPGGGDAAGAPPMDGTGAAGPGGGAAPGGGAPAGAPGAPGGGGDAAGEDGDADGESGEGEKLDGSDESHIGDKVGDALRDGKEKEKGKKVRCKDGSWSGAGGRRGACSHHGGVCKTKKCKEQKEKAKCGKGKKCNDMKKDKKKSKAKDKKKVKKAKKSKAKGKGKDKKKLKHKKKQKKQKGKKKAKKQKKPKKSKKAKKSRSKRKAKRNPRRRAAKRKPTKRRSAKRSNRGRGGR